MVAITSSTRNGSQEESDSLGSPEQHSPLFSFPRKSSRKQWSVQGEPRSLLKRLRSQLAEDGCPESQFAMAKALLEHKEDINYEENCHQAIFWLTQASLQGCLDATNLLLACFENGLGICEQNYEDVKRCLEMDHQEKLALVAGKQLFVSMAEGNEFVTEKRLEAKVIEVIGHKDNQPEKEDDSCTNMRKLLEEKFGGRKLNESSLMEAALEFVRGEVPPISLRKTKILEPNPGLHRILISEFHSAVMSVIDSCFYSKLTFLSRSPFVVFVSVFLSVIFYFFYGVLSEVFVVLLWVVSFLGMSLSATTVLVRLKNSTSFKLWSLTFQQFSQDLDVDVARSKYNSKFIFPYVTYVLSMLLYLMFLPIVNTNIETFVIPPLVLISISMITSLFQFNFTYNCLSSLLYIFANSTESQKYLKEWLSQALPGMKPYLLEESFTVYDHLCFNVNIGSILHALWFVGLVSVSFTIGLSGILLHGLCITWFHMTLIALRQQPTPCIYLSLAFWVFFFVLPQGFALLTVFIPSLLFLCFFIGSAPLWVAFLVFTTLSVSLGFLSRFNAKLASLLKCAIMVSSLIFVFHQQTDPIARVSPLKWEQFQNICLPTKESVGVHAVRDCGPLRGTIVHWEATIRRIDIDSFFNLPESAISICPTIVQPRLRCLFGQPFRSCDRDFFKTDADFQRCLILREAKGTEDCSLENWNEYTFHFVVSMETYFWKFSENSEIVLVGGNECREAAFNLSLLDRISFIGTLDEGLGTLRPRITLNSISCLDCKVKVTSSIHSPFLLTLNLFGNPQNLFNFFFGPTFTI